MCPAFVKKTNNKQNDPTPDGIHKQTRVSVACAVAKQTRVWLAVALAARTFVLASIIASVGFGQLYLPKPAVCSKVTREKARGL